jgi:hypothetical protein
MPWAQSHRPWASAVFEKRLAAAALSRHDDRRLVVARLFCPGCPLLLDYIVRGRGHHYHDPMRLHSLPTVSALSPVTHQQHHYFNRHSSTFLSCASSPSLELAPPPVAASHHCETCRACTPRARKLGAPYPLPAFLVHAVRIPHLFPQLELQSQSS